MTSSQLAKQYRANEKEYMEAMEEIRTLIRTVPLSSRNEKDWMRSVIEAARKQKRAEQSESRLHKMMMKDEEAWDMYQELVRRESED